MKNREPKLNAAACTNVLGGVSLVSKAKVQKGKAPWGSVVFRTRLA